MVMSVAHVETAVGFVSAEVHMQKNFLQQMTPADLKSGTVASKRTAILNSICMSCKRTEQDLAILAMLTVRS